MMERSLMFILTTWSIWVFTMGLYIPGDLILGGLFPIHRSDVVDDQTVCSRKIRFGYGIEPLEAMIFSLNQVNMLGIIKNVSLGLWVNDYCTDSHIARMQSLNFLKAFASKGDEDLKCNHRTMIMNRTVAVIGGHSTPVTREIAGIMSAVSIPLISYSATSPVLSDKNMYPHFFRTVPNDKHLGVVIMKMLDQLKWNYVFVVYSSTTYGIEGYRLLINAKTNYPNICIGHSHMITDHSTPKDYKKLVDKVYNDVHPSVMIIFAEIRILRSFLEAMKEKNVPPPFTWIVGDSVMYQDPSKEFMDQYGYILEGALLVRPESKKIQGFEKYFKDLFLNPKHAMHPSFHEFVNQRTNCSKNMRCGIDMKIFKPEEYSQSRYLNYIQSAVYAISHAIQNAIVTKCNGNASQECIYQVINRKDILQHLRDVTFNDSTGQPFEFVDGMEGPVRYQITIAQKQSKTEGYNMIDIGRYHGTNMTLELDRTQLKYRHLKNNTWQEFPNSHCSCIPNCQQHQIISPVGEDASCFICVDCDEYEKIVNGKCVSCSQGTKPNQNRTDCEPIPEKSIEYSGPWSIFATIVSVSGLIAVFLVFCVIRVYRNTPVIRASWEQSMYSSLLGITASCLMTFVILSEPTEVSCGVVTLGVGICFTLCYATQVTRIIRIHGRFNVKRIIPERLRCISPRSQLIIPGILTLIEMVILIIWMRVNPLSVSYIFPSRDVKLKICTALRDSSYLVGLAYPFTLLVTSSIFAFKTRKYPNALNESKSIGITTYATIIQWLSFVPVFSFWYDYSNRVWSVAMWLSLSGWIELACLFGPKLFIILLRPDKNTEDHHLMQ